MTRPTRRPRNGLLAVRTRCRCGALLRRNGVLVQASSGTVYPTGSRSAVSTWLTRRQTAATNRSQGQSLHPPRDATQALSPRKREQAFSRVCLGELVARPPKAQSATDESEPDLHRPGRAAPRRRSGVTLSAGFGDAPGYRRDGTVCHRRRAARTRSHAHASRTLALAFPPYHR